ncbi:helix-turn-helix transcriptional regulator [Terasakiella sp. A23]|uniref:AraC family transcriptional regulator n=1 Tax=Terasakiella sp. FCG-A23 TaxID=3080561 RepID=UPI002955BAC8|nr:helix-turn-helix transcriptional regulator [Terasakiella sp. A23]MDV7341364.1 helix-turn-helix transcriptional regulator [Terasakiella sp. A23]
MEIKRLEDIPRDLTLREGVSHAGTEVLAHHHEWGQLLYASSGVMQVMAQGSIWVIPPQRAVWIPPLVTHAIKVIQTVTLRNVYVAPQAMRDLPTECQVMFVTPLLRELIAEAVNYPPLYDVDGPQGRLARVLLDCLNAAPSSSLHLPVPESGPIQIIAEHLKEHPADESTLDEWADKLGTTTRTLARNFRKQTDMTFGQWRQQARLLEALSRLADNQPISHIAQDLGYSSQSAFSAMFRKALGVTPGQFFKDR